MISVKTTAYIGPDGTLTLAVPTPLPEMDVEVTVTVQPVALPAHGWPPGFFEATYGSLKDDPIERGPQGEYEIREALD